jgi:hypothetical protein
MLRLPWALLDEKTAAEDCAGQLVLGRKKGELIVVDFKALSRWQ